MNWDQIRMPNEHVLNYRWIRELETQNSAVSVDITRADLFTSIQELVTLYKTKYPNEKVVLPSRLNLTFGSLQESYPGAIGAFDLNRSNMDDAYITIDIDYIFNHSRSEGELSRRVNQTFAHEVGHVFQFTYDPKAAIQKYDKPIVRIPNFITIMPNHDRNMMERQVMDLADDHLSQNVTIEPIKIEIVGKSGQSLAGDQTLIIDLQ